MRKIVLASTSIRRKELMTFLGVPFDVVGSEFPEEDVNPLDFDEPSEYVATLAAGKAMMVADKQEDAIVIGVDTTVYLNGQYFGKPKDLNDARETLKNLRGKRHEVLTGVCVIDTLTEERQVQVVQSGVTFMPFSDEALERYISTSESLGKAGAYAIQGGAKDFLHSVQGSVSSVVGLPLTELAEMLESFGVEIDVDVRQLESEQFAAK